MLRAFTVRQESIMWVPLVNSSLSQQLPEFLESQDRDPSSSCRESLQGASPLKPIYPTQLAAAGGVPVTLESPDYCHKSTEGCAFIPILTPNLSLLEVSGTRKHSWDQHWGGPLHGKGWGATMDGRGNDRITLFLTKMVPFKM